MLVLGSVSKIQNCDFLISNAVKYIITVFAQLHSDLIFKLLLEIIRNGFTHTYLDENKVRLLRICI